MQFRKMPVVVEAWPIRALIRAFQWDRSVLPPEIDEAWEREEILVFPDHIIVKTLEGEHRGDLDDMLIQGVKREFYPCKADVFAATYEPVEPTATGATSMLPKYRCHKEVWALKIKEIQALATGALLVPEEPGCAPITVDSMWLLKHDPKPGGYWVKYEDGYESWSPAPAFEKGYTRL